jgi:FkbM family methyltransferase
MPVRNSIASMWQRMSKRLGRRTSPPAPAAPVAVQAEAEPLQAQVFGHTMFLDPADRVIGPLLLRDGYFEPVETEVLLHEIEPGDVVLDVGANIGYYTLLFARRVGRAGKVFAFEPDPDNFRLLTRNVQANGYDNVVLVPRAVTDRSGTARLYLCADNKGDHRLYDSGDSRPSVVVSTVALDDYFAGYKGPIDFIKMDTQGSEAAALRGMRRLLERRPGVTLVTEFWPIGLRRNGEDAAAYLEALHRHGFDLLEIDEDTRAVVPAAIPDLLRRFVPEEENFTNLLCARKPGRLG